MSTHDMPHATRQQPPVVNPFRDHVPRVTRRPHAGRAPARAFIATMSMTLACVGGCASTQRSDPYAPLTEADRDSTLAGRLNEQASDLMDKDPAQAEDLLRKALAADLYCGPAHNNLGVLMLRKGDLYGAASEFEWARKLMPGHPDPRMNLAMTLESAGRTDDALDAYASALEVYPEHLPSMQAMASLQVRTGRADDRTPGMLREIAMRGESETWKTWARTQMAMLDVR
jgi:Flp pilus assembly protein TadD